MAYTSKYQQNIDDLMNQINNSKFEYDPLQDAAYQQYQKDYTRYGKQAMEDTYGMVANRTGGLGSSYATTAANQSYNKYMQELAGKIPELRNLAYSMYQDDLSQKQNQLSNYMNLDATDYARWQYDDQVARAAAAAAASSGGRSSGGSGTSGGTGTEKTQGNTSVNIYKNVRDELNQMYNQGAGGTNGTAYTQAILNARLDQYKDALTTTEYQALKSEIKKMK